MVLAMLSSSGYSQTTPAARQLLDSMIDALGGRWFREVTEIQTTGRFYTFKRDEVVSADNYTDYLKFPDKERTEFGKDRDKTIQINRGLEGWVVKPPDKPKGEPDVQEQSPGATEEVLKDFQLSFDYVVRFSVNSPKSSVLSTGSEVVDSKRADVVEIRDQDKNLMRIFIDRETRLPLKTQTRRAGESSLHEETYANWHAFDGVMTPLMVVRYKDGVKTMEMRLQSAKYNPGFADSLFAPPARSK
jgi:hypothetical protein